MYFIWAYPPAFPIEQALLTKRPKPTKIQESKPPLFSTSFKHKKNKKILKRKRRKILQRHTVTFRQDRTYTHRVSPHIRPFNPISYVRKTRQGFPYSGRETASGSLSSEKRDRWVPLRRGKDVGREPFEVVRGVLQEPLVWVHMLPKGEGGVDVHLGEHADL